MRRRNGLSRPFTTPQISAWLALFVTIVQFLLAISPLLTIAVSIPATLVFMFLVIGSLYYGAKAQTVDPIDRRLRVFFRENPPLHDPYPPASKCWKCLEDPPRDPPTEEETKQCWICDTQVADHSMHCKFCNKCVGRFDHHCICKYLNGTLLSNEEALINILLQGSIRVLEKPITFTFTEPSFSSFSWSYHI